MAGKPYDLDDSTMLKDTVNNVVTCLGGSLFDFRFEQLFKISQESKKKFKTTDDFYIDLDDHAAVSGAISQISSTFCAKALDSRISKQLKKLKNSRISKQLELKNLRILKQLELKDPKRPAYFNSLWMIPFSCPYIISEVQLKSGEGSKPNSTTTQSETEFKKRFKEILFASVKPLPKDIFNNNVSCLERFIIQVLSDMTRLEAVGVTNALLTDCVGMSFKFGKTKWKNPPEYELQKLMDKFLSMITYFFEGLLDHYKKKDDGNAFVGLTMSNNPRPLTMNTPRDLWKNFTNNECPEYLPDTPMFKNSIEDVSISLQKGEKVDYLMGAKLKKPALSHNMIPEANFRALRGVFRQITPYMLFNDHSSYFLSDVKKTLYFEYPVKEGTWVSSNEDQVKLTGAPLGYIIIDQTKKREDGDLSLQLVMALNIFDRLGKFTNYKFGGVGIDNQNSEYHRLDRVDESDGYNMFVESLLREGFRNDVKKEKEPSSLSKPPQTGNDSDDQDNNASSKKPLRRSKRLASRSLVSSTTKKSTPQRAGKGRDDHGTGERRDEIGNIYPTDVVLAPKEYSVLERYSNTISTKVYLSMAECLENFDLRHKVNSNLNENVFIKLFDLYWLKTLHGMVWEGWEGIPHELLNQSDLNVMALLRNDYDLGYFKYVEERLKFTYLRELIALKRIESWNKNHPDNKINTPKLLQYGWIILDYPELLRSYGGPFFAFENLDFIHRNQKNETPKRTQSFKRQKRLLARAGIEHHDLKSSNYCFDYNDECFIIDFGISTVDDDKIYNRYDISDLMSPD